MIADKIKTLQELKEIRRGLAEKGLRVGFTSGVFDLLHAGHAVYLETAKTYCDVLIVGINSDASVKQNKGPDRPIISQDYRLNLIAALECVDYVFLFNERNNNDNITQLKPDFYIKAGDYTPAKLSSAPIVEAYGGKIIIVPFKEGLSSTAIIEKIQKQAVTVSVKRDLAKDCKAIFLDRDGTIIEHIEYLHEPEKVKEINGSFKALKNLQDAGYKIIIVTNQPGIGFGYFTKEEFFKVNKEFLRQASGAGVLIDKIYFCPHTAAEKCICRKPSPYFAERAAEELGLDLTKSYMIGDSASDIQFGKNAGLRTILLKCGLPTDETKCQPDMVAENLAQAAEKILK